MGVPKWIVSKAVSIAEGKANEGLDMVTAGKEADAAMDKSILGEKNSERIQRGMVTQKFLDFLFGLWSEDPREFVERLREEADKRENNIAGGY